MVEPNADTPGSDATRIFCPACAQPMLIRPEHLHNQVACPHCQRTLEPHRVTGAMSPGV